MRRPEGGAVKPRISPRQVSVGVVLCGLAVLIYAVSRPFRRDAQTRSCQSNLKQIGIATLQYVRDYDEKFPRAENWANAVMPYARGFGPNPESEATIKARFRCPTTGSFYALNIYHARISMVQDSAPRSSPLVFDVFNGQINQSDSGKSWPIPPIHTTLQTSGNNVLFSDAHVELRQSKPIFRPFAPIATPEIRFEKREKP